MLLSSVSLLAENTIFKKEIAAFPVQINQHWKAPDSLASKHTSNKAILRQLKVLKALICLIHYLNKAWKPNTS